MSTSASPTFTHRVASTFGTKTISFALGLLTTLLVARILGPEGRGVYYLAVLVPTTLITLGQFGLPSALVFFAGRGAPVTELRRASVRMVAPLSIVGVGLALFFEGPIRSAFLPGVTDFQYRLTLVAVPFLFIAMFASAILLGKQRIGTVNLLSLGGTVGSLIMLAALVWGARLGVDGAVIAYVVVGTAGSLAAAAVVLTMVDHGTGYATSVSGLIGYGVRIVPGTIATFLGYRADAFLIGALLASPVAVGLYSLAVGFSELLFYVPDSIAMAFFPRIAASGRSQADAFAPLVARQTVLLTVVAAIFMIPVASTVIIVLLPAFSGSIPALIVITPGIVALSISKVLSGYVSGLGKPLPVGAIAVVSVTVNIVANLILIPRVGIVGAATASLLSYSVNAILMVALSSRLARVSPWALVVPRPSDAVALVGLARILILGLLAGRRGLSRSEEPARDDDDRASP